MEDKKISYLRFKQVLESYKQAFIDLAEKSPCNEEYDLDQAKLVERVINLLDYFAEINGE